MIDGYANPVAPQFLELALPAARQSGEPIDWSGVVVMSVRVRRADGSTITWSTEDVPPTLTVQQVGGQWTARHVYAPAPSELPFVSRTGAPTMHVCLDVTTTIDGVPIQIPSVGLTLKNDRTC